LTVSQALTLARASSAITNSGSIDVSGGDLTVTQSGTAPSITNSGVLTIGAGRTVSITGGTLNQSAGGVAGSGTLSLSSVVANFTTNVTNATTTFAFSNSTLNGPGTITNAAGSTMTLLT